MRHCSIDSARRACARVVLVGGLVVWPYVIAAQPPTATPSLASSPSASSSVPSADQPPPPRPPFPNRMNEALPSWLRVRGEFRERIEAFDNSGFVEERDDAYFLSRFRFTVSATRSNLSATIQVHDARVGNKDVGPTGSPFKAALDIRQAFVDIGTARMPLAVRLGRQDFVFGDQRLVGHANWLNSGRSFDAVRLTVRSKTANVDLFAASVVRILDDELDKSGNGNRFAGAYVSSSRWLAKGTAEPYVFWRRDVRLRAESGATGSLQQVTTGLRLVGALPARLDYNVEMDLQRGSLATDAVRTWAGHWQLRRTLAAKMAPHLTAEFNYASGDADPTDGVRGTFDQLYPTAHDKYGLADQVGWRNIQHVRVGVDVTPMKATPIAVNYHSYWLAHARDGLYAASGALLARIPTGATTTHVGQELDVQLTRPLFPQLLLSAGYAHLFAGAFLKEATPGKSYSGPFVMATYVFLAEK